MYLLVPGKTFLVGEYSVLCGGQALVIATQPEFKISSETSNFKIHANSPAGKIDTNLKDISLYNPYGAGGFGQSTAEYIYAWTQKNKVFKLTRNYIQQMFNDYKDLFDSQKKPSGADLISQLIGHITLFNQDMLEIKSYDWPFEDLGFFIISTGLKVQTHQHIQELEFSTLTQLKKTSEKVIELFQQKNSENFLSELKSWVNHLHDLKLLHDDIVQLKSNVEKITEVLFYKPCGALGADVGLVFFKKNSREIVRNKLSHLSLKIVTDELQLALGARYVD